MIALVDFERLVEDTSGLNAGSIGSSTIERGVRERLHALGVREMHEYWIRLSESEDELQSLIEAIVVAETWFFRDMAAFDALQRIVRTEWTQRAAPDAVLNVLSLPCSTGEEPYSIAMALLDAGLPPERFRVLGIDISERSVAHARLGTYGRSAFRGQDLTFRDRYFSASDRGYSIGERVRRQVRFQRGNLFGTSCAVEPERFDIVFCRNLLIYFDQSTQDRAIARLTRLLASNGVLFVGSAETGVLLNHPELSAQLPRAYAFHRESDTGVVSARVGSRTPRRTVARKSVPAPPLPVRRPADARAARPDTWHRLTAPAGADAGDRLAGARQLADEGRFTEAASGCEEQLRINGPSAAAFHLLGLMRDANGDWLAAAECYRKALYLDPGHGEALIHLALLMEQHGREAEARLLRNRLQRLAGRASS